MHRSPSPDTHHWACCFNSWKNDPLHWVKQIHDILTKGKGTANAHGYLCDMNMVWEEERGLYKTLDNLFMSVLSGQEGK